MIACNKQRILAAAVAGVMSTSVNVYAQVLEEVVVTAQKRTEDIQDVPISIVAVNSDKLEKAGITSAKELGKIVPNLDIQRSSQASATAIVMRGIGSAGNNAIDPSVAPFIDGVYIPRAGAILSSFLDVASVEVLRGPQGTLFGRNATTGALLINTNKPEFDEFYGEVAAEYGDYDTYLLRGIANVPVSDTVAMRFALQGDGHDGYFHNDLDGKDYGDREVIVGRASLRWQPSDSLEWVLRSDYAEMGGDGSLPAEVSSHQGPEDLVNILGNVFGPLSPDITDPFDGDVSQVVVGDLDDTQWGISSDLNWDLESDYRIRWIGAYREWDNEQLDGDVVFTGLDTLNRVGFYDSESMSQEVQLISPENSLFGESMDFVAGLYYFQEDYELGENLNYGPQYCPVLVGSLVGPGAVPLCSSLPQMNASEQLFTQDAESFAVFLETNWELTDDLELKVGARYTTDDKEGEYLQVLNNPFTSVLRAPEEGDHDFDDDQFTYRLVLSWFFSDDAMAFANYSTGYKSGGINSNGSAVPLNENRIFDSENVKNAELGVKSTVWDGRMQLNATLYWMELDDFQDRAFQDASFIVTNAGTLEHKGLEAEMKAALTDNLSADFAMAYLDSEFTDFEGATPLAGCSVLPPPGTPQCPNPQDNTGKRAPYAPEWEFSLGLAWDDEFANGMPWNASLRWQFVDERFAGSTELSDQTISDSYNILDARVSLSSADASWTVYAWGSNLTDERYEISHFTQVLGPALGLIDTSNGDTVYRHYLSPPRTWGVGVKYEF